MSVQAVDTNAVLSCATVLRNVNDHLTQVCGETQTKVDQLRFSWTSAAGTRALDRIDEVFRGSTARHTVIDNYVRMLQQQVDPSYNAAEDTNRQLSGLFK